MNWHARYLQQAAWTHSLRAYLFEKAGLERAGRILEVGCGTGAILAGLSSPVSLPCTAPNAVQRKCHGLDLEPAALTQCRIHAPAASLTRGDAHSLPFKDDSFDITFCHFLLLWVKDPLQALLEMKRVTKKNGYILAFAEPDYTQRIDKPDALAALGKWQTESLQKQGAQPAFGARLAETFREAGIRVIEAGPMQGREVMRTADERAQEWDVIEADLTGMLPAEEIQKMRVLDEEAWGRGERVLHVPVFFAAGAK